MVNTAHEYIELSDRPAVVDAGKAENVKSAPTPIGTAGLENTEEEQLNLGDVSPVTVEVRHLGVSINTSPSWFEPSTYPSFVAAKFSTAPRMKTLLQDVSAQLSSGSLTAIMGGSGSGKTTLLNAMAQRVTGWRLKQGGTITFNGQSNIHVVQHAYVMQHDILIPTLTVRETLQYAADLRLAPKTSTYDRDKVVEQVIRELGLKECANTPIGNHQHRGCSGGEKRRVSIGIQLLANPSVLFLDEPTSGLDATSALQTIQTLKMLAQKGRTIIITIHQPRSEIWDYFENLIVLSGGRSVYSGPRFECLPWFQSQGLHLPSFVNPAEFIIDVSSVDNRTPALAENSNARVDALKKAWELESQKDYAPLEDKIQPIQNQPIMAMSSSKYTKFYRQVSILTGRTIKVTYRDPLGLTATILEAIVMGVATGYINHGMGRDATGIRSREGALYMAAAMQAYLILIFETYRMSIDISIFDRESLDKCVDPLPFIISRRLARLPTEDIPVPLIYSTLFYFIAGFDTNPGKFFTFFLITLINHYVSVSCAMTCVVASRHFATASLIANLASTLQSLAGGLFVQSNTIPVYVRWTKWIAFGFYSFGAYAGNELQGSFYSCPYPGGKSNPACIQYTGEYVMDSLGLPVDWIWRHIVILASFIVMFCLLSTIGLHFFKVQISVAQTHASIADLSAGKEIISPQSSSESRTINVGLDGFALVLEKRTIMSKGSSRKVILSPISTIFPAGVLNVIMGPSGGGKTSLLTAMAQRLRNSIGTRYQSSGRLTFNGAVPSDIVVQALCSYVYQDDGSLLPSLTVRETLRFAAGLRLPSFMTIQEKHQRADEVLLNMGLKECADNLIGSDLIKGISTGERRRVSIGVQILTNPRILLLDEPTSGLDAFTANSILEMLRGLAKEGRTIILSLHQVRSNSFSYFGNVLLLAQGGQLVYSGLASEMLDYLDRHGHKCPAHTNPADFALDVITIDLQQDERELKSKIRVQKLVDAWTNRVTEPGTSTQQKSSGIGGIAEPEASRIVDCRYIKNEPADDDGSADTYKVPNHQPVGLTSFVSTCYKSFNKASVSVPAQLGASIRQRAPFTTALPLLAKRMITNTFRQPHLVIARIGQFVGLTILVTLFFAPLHADYYSVQNRAGILQEVASFYVIGMIQNTAVYPNERDLFYQEDDDGLYTAEAFLASYMLIEVPLELFCSLICGMVFITVIGLPQTGMMYFVCVFSLFGLVSCGESIGIMLNTLFEHTGFAFSIMTVVSSIAIAMSGVLAIDMPKMFQVFNYLTPTRYTTRAVAFYSLGGLNFTCTEQQRAVDGSCPINTGEDVLRLYHFDESPTVNLAALAGCIVVYRALAWVFLKGARASWGTS